MLNVLFKTFLGLGSILSICIFFENSLGLEGKKSLVIFGTYLGIFSFFFALIVALLQHVAKITRKSHSKEVKPIGSDPKEKMICISQPQIKDHSGVSFPEDGPTIEMEVMRKIDNKLNHGPVKNHEMIQNMES